jgi:hypothetical protein
MTLAGDNVAMHRVSPCCLTSRLCWCRCEGGCWLKSRRGSVVGGGGTGRQVSMPPEQGWTSGILTGEAMVISV